MAGRTADNYYLTVFVGASDDSFKVVPKFVSPTNFLPWACGYGHKHFYLTAKSGASGFSLLP